MLFNEFYEKYNLQSIIDHVQGKTAVMMTIFKFDPESVIGYPDLVFFSDIAHRLHLKTEDVFNALQPDMSSLEDGITYVTNRFSVVVDNGYFRAAYYDDKYLFPYRAAEGSDGYTSDEYIPVSEWKNVRFF